MSEVGSKPAEMRRAFGEELVELGRENRRIVVLDNDVNTTTLSSLFRQAFPDRFFEVGIAEKNLFGTAAGLATGGYIPFPTTFAAFATRCALDQITISICYPNLNVKIPAHYIGGSGAGASHIVVEDLAVMRALPNMRVADPADNADLRAVMRAAMEVEGPVYFRVNKLAVPTVFEGDHRFEWGKGAILRPGSEVSIFSTGLMTVMAMEAARLLATDGIEAEVVHLASIKPIDEDLIAASAARTGCAVSAENASVIGGFGAAVAEVLCDRCPVPLRRVGFQDTWVHSGDINQILDHYGLRPANIAAAARASIAAAHPARVETR
jgi:transketolase